MKKISIVLFLLLGAAGSYGQTVTEKAMRVQLLRGTNVFVGTNFIGDGSGLTNLLVQTTNMLPRFDVARVTPARPDDGLDDTTNIQSVIEMAASAGGGVVYLGPGEWLTQPTNSVFQSSRKSEGHRSCLTIWSNNVFLVLDGAVLKTQYGYHTDYNVIGAGSAAGDTYASAWGPSNIGIIGGTIDGNGFNGELTQIYHSTNVWHIGNTWKNTGNNDALDSQYCVNVLYKDCTITGIEANAFGVQNNNTVIDSCVVLDGGGQSDPTQAMLQITTSSGPTYIVNSTFRGGSILLGGGIFIGCSFYSTNTASTRTNFIITQTASFSSCDFGTAISESTGRQIWVNNSLATFTTCKFNNQRPVLESSGASADVNWLNCFVKDGNSWVFYPGPGRSRIIGGAYVTGNNGLVRGEIAGCSNMLVMGIVLDTNGDNVNAIYSSASSTINWKILNNVIERGRIYINTSGDATVIQGNIVSGGIVNASSALQVYNNWLGGGLISGTVPSNWARNVCMSNSPAFTWTSVTPTTTQTLFTNTLYIPVELHVYGGTVEAIGKNGTQISSTLAGSKTIMLGSREWVGITNSSTSGLTIRWIQGL